MTNPRESAPSEQIYHSDDTITITNKVVEIGSVTYALAHITSLRTGRVSPDRFGIGLVGFIIGLLVGVLVYFGLQMVFGEADFLLLVIPFVGIIGFVYAAMSQKDRYRLLIHLASGETDSVVSGDVVYIQYLHDHLHKALLEFY